MKTIVMSILLMLAAGTATAEDTHVYHVYGVGTESCGSWLEERRKAIDYWHGTLEWTLGYVSAYGHFSGEQLRHTDAQAVAAWLDKYCAENPVMDIENASNALIQALHKGT
jgi:hypothetical protein